MRYARISTLGLLFFLVTSLPVYADLEMETVRKSLVRIHSTIQRPNYQEPWQTGQVRSGFGTGFVIAGNRVMTNAHVVSDARLILLEREGDPRLYPAKIQHIAHDCDLAILMPDDQNFFQSVPALSFDGIPPLHSTVSAVGYPIGGQRLSITRGVISRIEFNAYSHSGIDSHLTIQIDAAINPGNSGGPVIRDNQVVGVAFQGIHGSKAQNIGYMIPTPVILRFLEDISDGEYNGYLDLGMRTQNLQNQDYRSFLHLPDNDGGVIVTKTYAIGLAHALLQVDDILLSIDGHPISSKGTIVLGSEDVPLAEIVERKYLGQTIVMEIIRNDRPVTVEIPLNRVPDFTFPAWRYDKKPRYLIFAGLTFQPLSKNFISAHQISSPDLLYYYESFLEDDIYLDRPEIIVLSNILPDPINSGLAPLQYKIVETVNGKDIGTLDELVRALQEPVSHYVIELRHGIRPIVIKADQLAEARARIAQRYQIHQESYTGKH